MKEFEKTVNQRLEFMEKETQIIQNLESQVIDMGQ
jgi:hypothetical protein